MAAAIALSLTLAACENGNNNDGGETPPPITVLVESVALNTNELALTIGDEELLSATVLPENADNKQVTWTSSSPLVASVTDEGLVKALTAGTTTITVTTEDGGFTDECEVTVESGEPVVIPVTGVTLNVTEHKMSAGETLQLIATVLPANATNKKITWNFPVEVMSIDETGLVRAEGTIQGGKAAVAVITDDGEFTAVCHFALEGVYINGVRWAERSVGAAGTFVKDIFDTGHYYQWGKNISWTGSGNTWTSSDGSAWDSTGSAETTWPSDADPCPAGYRLPTRAEMQTLADSDNVEQIWLPINGVNGAFFLNKGTSVPAIFVPASGSLLMGMMVNFGNQEGYYWASDTEGSKYAYRMKFNQLLDTPTSMGTDFGSVPTNNGYQVRCVME